MSGLGRKVRFAVDALRTFQPDGEPYYFSFLSVICHE